MVADGGTVISIPQAINLMNAPIFSVTQKIIHRTSPVIFMRQTAISLPHMIIDGTATIISESQIIISRTPQVRANEWVPDSPHANNYLSTEDDYLRA